MKKIKLDVKVTDLKAHLNQELETIGIAETCLSIHGTFDKQRANVPVEITIDHNNESYSITFIDCKAYMDEKMINMTSEEKNEIVYKAFKALRNEE